MGKVLFSGRVMEGLHLPFLMWIPRPYHATGTTRNFRNASIHHQTFQVPSKWRVHPHRDISCMDTAYVREDPSPKWPYKVQYLNFRYLKFLVNPASEADHVGFYLIIAASTVAGWVSNCFKISTYPPQK